MYMFAIIMWWQVAGSCSTPSLRGLATPVGVVDERWLIHECILLVVDRAGAAGSVNPDSLATRLGRHRAGIVDADVAVELGHVRCSPAFTGCAVS
jgi:hypothetical protein